MTFELINGAEMISLEQLKFERDQRRELIKNGQKDDPRVKNFGAVESVMSLKNGASQKTVSDIFRKAVNSYDIQGRRITSYFDEMFELANLDTTFTKIIEANGIVESSDVSVSWREESPNASSTPEFFNDNHELPGEAEATEAIRSNTCGTYGNVILVSWKAQELGMKSDLGAYNVLASQMRKQMLRMKRFREEKLLVNSEQTSEIVGDTPQWNGFYTDSTLNASAIGGNETEALLNALHVAIGNPTSIDGLGVHTGLVGFTTAAQLDVLRAINVAKFDAETSQTYLADQARLSKMLPGVNLDPDQVVFFKTRLGAVMGFVYNPYFTASTTFVFDPNMPRVVKFKMMGTYGPWSIKREIPELVDEFAIFDIESILNPLKATRGSHTTVT